MHVPLLQHTDSQMGSSENVIQQSESSGRAGGLDGRRSDATTVDIDHHGGHWQNVHAVLDVLSSKTRSNKRSSWSKLFKPDDLHPRVQHQSWRHQLGKVLESEYAHWTILALILIDVLATSVDIMLTVHTKANDVKECASLLEVCTGPEQWEPHSTDHMPLFFTSTGILGLLCLNIFLLLVAFGLDFFRHPGYVLDLAIIPTALFLEIFLDSEVLALLVILNLWRLVRVAHGVFTVTDDAVEEEVKSLKETLSVLQHHSDSVQEELKRAKAQVQQLELALGSKKGLA